MSIISMHTRNQVTGRNQVSADTVRLHASNESDTVRYQDGIIKPQISKAFRRILFFILSLYSGFMLKNLHDQR